MGTGLGRGRLFPFGRGGTIAPANSPIASENVPEFCRGNTDAFALPYRGAWGRGYTPGAHNEERKGRGEGARSTHALN